MFAAAMFGGFDVYRSAVPSISESVTLFVDGAQVAMQSATTKPLF